MSVEQHSRALGERGFVVLPGLVDLPTVVKLCRAINHDVKTNPFMWHDFGESKVNRNALLSVPGISEVVRNPLVLELVGEVFGGHARFEEAVVMLYSAGAEEIEPDWHRDVPHNLENPYRAEYMQLLIYLSNVTVDTHRFCVFPESSAEPVVPQSLLVATHQPFELVGGPGSAILFNSSSLHGVRKVLGGRGRRSLHIYFGHKDRPCSSASTIVPASVLRSLAPEERALFEKRNRLSSLIFE